MSDIPKPTKRIARPSAEYSKKVDLESVLQDVYRIVQADIDSLRTYHERTETQARILQGHAKLLLDVIKEERISEKEGRDAAKKMTDADIINYIVSSPTLLSAIKKAIKDIE
jgi:translation initiation factor 2B subunit (eIF-2B alpha/beta/delta family)